MLSALVGVLVAIGLPGIHTGVTRSLLGWNAAVWLCLLLVGAMMMRADHARLRRIAMAQAEGAVTVLAAVVLAAFASLAGILLELAAAKLPGAPHERPHVLFALSTVLASWLLMPTMFTLAYASAYYEDAGDSGAGRGLRFPDTVAGFRPHYIDFLYFAFTIAVASQTADVSVTTPAMRRMVLLHAVMSFMFNTAILALSVNVAAGLF